MKLLFYISISSFLFLIFIALTYDKTVTPSIKFLRKTLTISKDKLYLYLFKIKSVYVDMCLINQNLIQRNRTSVIFLGLSLAIIVGYFISLHPFSLFIGGITFALLGWVAPSLLTLTISAALVTSLNTRRIHKYILFLPVSIVVGINTNIMHIIDSFNYPSITVTKSISKVIKITKEDYVKVNFLGVNPNTVDSNAILFPSNYFISAVTVGGDEGCMCMYFLKRNSFFDKDLNKSLSPIYKHYAKGNLRNYIITINTSIINENYGIVKIEIINNNELCSQLTINNIPYKVIKSRYGRDKKLLNGYFVKNTFDMLFHNNFWSYIVGNFSRFNYDQHSNEVSRFIHQAVNL